MEKKNKISRRSFLGIAPEPGTESDEPTLMEVTPVDPEDEKYPGDNLATGREKRMEKMAITSTVAACVAAGSSLLQFFYTIAKDVQESFSSQKMKPKAAKAVSFPWGPFGPVGTPHSLHYEIITEEDLEWELSRVHHLPNKKSFYSIFGCFVRKLPTSKLKEEVEKGKLFQIQSHQDLAALSVKIVFLFFNQSELTGDNCRDAIRDYLSKEKSLRFPI